MSLRVRFCRWRCVASLQRKGGKHYLPYPSRFLAVINRHGLARHMVRCVVFPLAGSSVFRPATRIGHIGVAAEGLTTGAFNGPIEIVRLSHRKLVMGQAESFDVPGQQMHRDLR
ncbi:MULTISPECIES: hypothetical protein [unclassified Rhizobium]|uniref:hypothetical protein n=1 Tax=unclassified Rhizobium TaxID=2613769 RepID=UPI00117A8C64|nr:MULTISPECIES: hypothetical protein [unclassified Rhizobium]